MTMLLWNVSLNISKKEEVNRKSYASFADLKLSLFEYINGFYNSVRTHSHNNGLTSNQAEINFI